MHLGKEYYLLLGLLALCLSYVMFTGQQYFSALAMDGLFLLAIIAVAAFLIPYLDHHIEKKPSVFFFMLVLTVVIAVLEYSYLLLYPGVITAIGFEAVLLAVSVSLSIAALHHLAKRLEKTDGLRCALYAIAALALVALAAYSVMYVSTGIQWNGVDEVAFNYYAGYLLLHGQNPYTASMAPILAEYNIVPTVQLNGQYETAYDYPALSFLAFLPIPLLGIKNMLSFTYVTIFLTLVSGFIIYRRSGLDRKALIPLAGWFVATFSLVGVGSQYLAIPIFLLLAYLLRQRAWLSGVMLGLAASTLQLAWFALPFFYVLAFKEHGKRHALYGIAATAAVFLAINGYFMLASPASISNIFSLFGLSKLVLYGTNIMQIISYYALPYWYSAFISVMCYSFVLALYFFYTKTLKPLLAIVPMMIFFLSWRNITIYGLPFIAILLAVYFWKDDHACRDMISSKYPMLCAVVALVAIGVTTAIFAHQSYLESSKGLHITAATPIISVQSGYYGEQFGLLGIKVTLNDTLRTAGNVSFYVVSRDPANAQYLLADEFNASGYGTVSNYTLNYSLGLVGSQTSLVIFAFNKDYITSKTLNLTTLYQLP